jgi:hypothetical protein
MSRAALLLLVGMVAAVLVVVVTATQLRSEDEGGASTAPTPTPPPGEEPAAAPPAVSLQEIAGGLSEPLYVAAPDEDERLFIVERAGRILVYEDGQVLGQPFLDIRGEVSVGGERGLLSMAFHPRFAETGRFYVNYTDRAGDTRVVEYRAHGDDATADATSAEVMLTVRQPYANHNGGQLQVGPDNLLYVGMGDGGGSGDPEGNAQDDDSRLGKLLRSGLGASPSGWQTFAKGLRNPWRFSFDRASGDLWIADVGASSVEEVNRLPADHAPGLNFGWPAYEGSEVYLQELADDFDRDELVWPVTEYTHDQGNSITGGYVYRGEALPDLQGWYVFGDYVSGRVWAFNAELDERVPLEGADGEVDQLVSFGEDGSGELYVVSLSGSVFRLGPAD